MRRAVAVAIMQRELVERAIRGDHDAFAQLVGDSIARLYGIATIILRDRDRAQDAVQEALVSAWKDVGALRHPEAWDSWLYRLTVRACYRQARHERRRILYEVNVTPDPEPAAGHDMTTSLDERDRLGRELGRLPLDQRAVLVLHFVLDLPLADVADILGLPIGTTKSRLHRGLAVLRASLRADTIASMALSQVPRA